MRTYLLVAYFLALATGMYYSIVLMDLRRFGWLGVISLMFLLVLFIGGMFNLMNLHNPGHLL